MPNPPSLKTLDVTTKRGTFLVLTDSGSRYLIVADKLPSGYVRVEGGRERFTEPTPAIIGGVASRDKPQQSSASIKVGQPIVLGLNIGCHDEHDLRTTPVHQIFDVRRLDPSEIEEIGRSRDEVLRMEDNRNFDDCVSLFENHH